ncbi:MAG: UDP-N-acetylmuramoyl-tripeptide--D-alanyl-D-alanine ligase [Chloroflexi bacterium]|nr:UDP-N-acetylmuramoyl-tripeptide--D-alanyl-D-alanine ligase [Chloroflexota bacterium]MCL5274228.1 UDP-N-acetylmuramoyl-tripeptide--D-alanyl-D-alanine ligase [Chloroflexota bacterium]
MLTLADVFASLIDKGLVDRLAPELANYPVHEVVIDSRKVLRGDLFVALPGEKVNGHDFVGHALGRGAIAVFVHEDIARDDFPDAVWVDVRQAAMNARTDAISYREGASLIIRVNDTLDALQRLSAYWRDRFSPGLRVVGITGSIGKTTTKELTAQVLSKRYRVLKSEGNQNNEIGVPLTLLKLTPEYEYAVIEMGMYTRGEIALFASLAKPHIGVVTMIAHIHLERLGSLENIVLAKTELVEALPADGVAILNDDDEYVRAMASAAKARVMTYGLTPRADIWADEIASYGLDGISFRIHQGAQSFPMRVPLLGRHSVHTALRAAAVGRVEGLTWEEILEGFLTPAPQLRLAVAGGPFGSLVLDDTYNASEESTLAALNLLEEINGSPHIAVLGDMLELGDAEEQAHRNVGCRAALVARDVICVGQRARWIAEEAIACGAAEQHVRHVEDNAAALAVLRELVREKSVILVKGSRGMRMEEIVNGLAEMAGLV